MMETPFYWYDRDLLEETVESCVKAAAKDHYHIHYALKANFNADVLACMHRHGLGADCVSGNEVKKAIEIGFPKEKIVFAGVGKRDDELLYALKSNIFCFNCESLQELEVLGAMASELGVEAPVALRINPEVEAGTHRYITTGLRGNKFGVSLNELDEITAILTASSSLTFYGLHVHVGSQITDLTVFKRVCDRVNELQLAFEARGLATDVLNVGGGLGIDYEHPDLHAIPDFAAYFDVFSRNLVRRAGQQVHFELGRSLVAQCGYLISKVLYIKKGSPEFAVIDAGMTELMRPALYQAYHQIDNWSQSGPPTNLYNVVGPICESSDTFRKDAQLPATQRGDLLAIRSAGAYGEVMSSSYNLRDRVSSVFLSKSELTDQIPANCYLPAKK